MKDPKFYNSDGSLTGYALACGYVEKDETETTTKQLYREHNVYHVRHGAKGTQLQWETFDTLKEARKRYNSIKLGPNGKEILKPMSKNSAENWRDFNATCSEGEVKETNKCYYKHVNMFGNKTLIYWKETGKISTREGHVNP